VGDLLGRQPVGEDPPVEQRTELDAAVAANGHDQPRLVADHLLVEGVRRVGAEMEALLLHGGDQLVLGERPLLGQHPLGRRRQLRDRRPASTSCHLGRPYRALIEVGYRPHRQNPLTGRIEKPPTDLWSLSLSTP
jgi:hypothetical protein